MQEWAITDFTRLRHHRACLHNGSAVSNERLRLVGWCLVMSVFLAVGTWALFGPPGQHTVGMWHSPAH